MGCLVERRARTSKGGARLKKRAFSRNFHVIGTWLSKQMWETNRRASSIEGKSTPAEFRLELSSVAHRYGSLFLTWADMVCSITESHTLLRAAISQLPSNQVLSTTKIYAILSLIIRGETKFQERTSGILTWNFNGYREYCMYFFFFNLEFRCASLFILREKGKKNPPLTLFEVKYDIKRKI